MDVAMGSLLRGGEQEFLRTTRTALKILQNILSDPSEEKYRMLRIASKYVAKEGVPGLLQALGFQCEGEYYVLGDSVTMETLLERKLQLVSSRQQTGLILGWDVPSTALQFSAMVGAGRYGDILRGRMDGREVAVKTLKPDSGAAARTAFDRELDVLCKVCHPNIVKLCGITLTSEPTSVILEYVQHAMLDVLHRNELTDVEILKYARQVACGMEYLHSQDILHCDLAARNLLLDDSGVVRVCDFSLSCRDGSLACRLPASSESLLSVRWTAPEVLKQFYLTKHADVWSFGVLFYELDTAGSVPYASFNNSDVRTKVLDGYRLPQPQSCPDEFYTVMMKCWAQRATERPHFPEIVRNLLSPLESKLASSDGKIARHSSSSEQEPSDVKSSSPKGSKSKVKELSYPAVVAKGGGLVRVYTALISPFQHRVVIVCSKKTNASEVVQTALAKCGKTELDAKSHSIALVSGHSSGSPARYLDPDDKILSVKVGTPPTAMFVLCVRMPGAALLDVIDSVRQNPAYTSAFDPRTRGYLVMRRNEGEGKTKGKGGGGEWKRLWCVLDGSTLLCYRDEEDEGVKEYESFLEFKGCTVTPTSSKKGHLFTVNTAGRDHYSFSAMDKADMQKWIEAIEAASSLAASPILLHASGGAIMQTGFVECQEFAYESNGVSPLNPMMQRRLGSDVDFAGTYAAVDYGKHWTVIKNSGLVQCLLEGRPETLFDVSKAKRVKVNNPREMKEGVDYSIEVEAPESRFVLRAELPTDHFDWVLAIERILRDNGVENRIRGHRSRESGYVAIKRLLTLQTQGGGSKLYSLPRCLNHMEDVYDVPKLPPQMQKNSPSGSKRSELLSQRGGNMVPLPPKDYLPPPIPPRESTAPPLPPKGRPVFRPPSDSSDPDDEYVLMQQMSATPPCYSGSRARLPSTPQSLSQPITIPSRRSSKRSILLRTDSESSSHASSPPPLGTSLSDLQEGTEWVIPNRSRSPSISSAAYSLTRNTSSHSLSSYHCQLSSTSLNSNPTLPKNGGQSSGYNSPLLSTSPSPCLHRSQSQRSNTPLRQQSETQVEASMSDGMMVSEAKWHFHHHPISRAGYVLRPQSLNSDGYCSSHSSSDDLAQLPPGWERAYCQESAKYFYYNSDTGATTWNLQEILVHCQQDKRQSREGSPGNGWRLVRMDDGRVYYYHEVTRETTWSVQDTWA